MTRLDPHSERLRQTLDQELGPEVRNALEDPDVVEIYINPPDGSLWVSSHSRGTLRCGSVPLQQVHALTATIATYYQKSFTADSPILEANLPFLGARYTALCPPVSPEGLSVAIRKGGRLFTLAADYEVPGIIEPARADLLRHAIREGRRNILISGGTGTGKTALLSALLAEIAPSERVLALEDTPELRAPKGLHFVPLRTSYSVDLGALVKTTLRLSPDRLIIGEVRGPEALNLLVAWNTGTRGGLATLHSDTAAKALERLELLVQLGGVPISAARALIASAVHLVIHLSGRGTSRRLEEVLEVRGLQNGSYQLSSL